MKPRVDSDDGIDGRTSIPLTPEYVHWLQGRIFELEMEVLRLRALNTITLHDFEVRLDERLG
jgi:hypothetical protein